MTLKAREVLADCRLGLEMLEEETNLPRWRILWAGTVALTRAIGHVLDKVDGEDVIVKQVAGEFFKRWKRDPEHEIFREFIEHERNSVLKEYRSYVHPNDEVAVVAQLTVVPENGGDPQYIGEILNLDENIYRPMLEGPWEGNDCRDVLAEALDWWDTQLSNIDNAVKNKGAT